MVKHQMIPAHSSESGGAPVKPAHTLDKVLVSAISKTTEEKYMKYVIAIFISAEVCVCLGCYVNTHISCISEFKTAREQSSLIEARKEALGEKKTMQLCKEAKNRHEVATSFVLTCVWRRRAH